jgi:tRNA A-37 threonylcarbamoyl transferase component Bud32
VSLNEVRRTVGRYDVLDVIGRGGAAVVYLARQRDLDRPVALKELAPQQAADPTFAARFIEESRLAASLSHPNIVTVHEYFEHEGVPYIAMEQLPRGSLRQYIGGLSLAQIAGVLEGVLAGLAHGQAQAVVHRDLKPENLLVTADGRVKIADFGVARAYNEAVTRGFATTIGTTIGTPSYMAPEQALGRGIGPATDLYSLGIIAWELLVGHVPFAERDTPLAVLYQQVHEPIPPVRSVAPDVDVRLAAWLDGMLAKEPEDRHPGAGAAWERLEDIVLELLGPRWRRGSALGPEPGAEPTRSPREPATPLPLTPIPEQTIADHGRSTTIHRLARRHEGAELVAAAAAASEPRRLALLGSVALAVIAGALVGVIAGGSGAHARRVPARTITAPSPTAAVVAALSRLAEVRAPALAALAQAPSAAAQARAATSVQRAYTATARRLAGTPIGQTASGLAGDYAALAAAASAHDRTAYERAGARVASAERTLHDQAGTV